MGSYLNDLAIGAFDYTQKYNDLHKDLYRYLRYQYKLLEADYSENEKKLPAYIGPVYKFVHEAGTMELPSHFGCFLDQSGISTDASSIDHHLAQIRVYREQFVQYDMLAKNSTDKEVISFLKSHLSVTKAGEHEHNPYYVPSSTLDKDVFTEVYAYRKSDKSLLGWAFVGGVEHQIKSKSTVLPGFYGMPDLNHKLQMHNLRGVIMWHILNRWSSNTGRQYPSYYFGDGTTDGREEVYWNLNRYKNQYNKAIQLNKKYNLLTDNYKQTNSIGDGCIIMLRNVKDPGEFYGSQRIQ